MNRYMMNGFDIKVTVVHKTYREHYVLFRGSVPNSLNGLLLQTKTRMIRSGSPILDQFDESLTFGYWTGRIACIDKDGDEILLVDDFDFRGYINSLYPGAMGTMIIRLTSTKPEPDEASKQKPIHYAFDSSVPVINADAAGMPIEVHEALRSGCMPPTSKPLQGKCSGIPQTDGRKLPLHKNVQCDVCDGEIRGHRYKCMTCQNYDLCMSCEGKYRHKEHIMLRLPTPEIRRHGAYSVFDKLRYFVTKMTPLVTGEETHTGSTTEAVGRAAEADHSTMNQASSSKQRSSAKTSVNNPDLRGFLQSHTGELAGKSSECSQEKNNTLTDESLTSTAKQELQNKHDEANGNGSVKKTQEKDSDERASVEEDDSTDELWTVLDGKGSTTPEEVLVQLDSPGPSVTSPVKNTEPTTAPIKVDEAAAPSNRTQPDVRSKMNQLTELVAAAVLEGTRLMSVPSPERPVPPPTIQDDHDEQAVRVDGAAAKESGASSVATAATVSSDPTKTDPTKIYSELPHVNHAIHTLITMGFSNDNGWLTRLLESLDGDIPKALDLLLLQPSATNNPPRS
ncbi:hypothetical protein AND_009491 [Anopheles darlingi]|uniref:ZZ-type domain-containing protein n=1 Tax=Anopheles darlingi TaxID=43151 RepID=W5J7T8_ANODA|nr:hypothetical protein AND_009491 [Anopheles darlingi]